MRQGDTAPAPKKTLELGLERCSGDPQRGACSPRKDASPSRGAGRKGLNLACKSHSGHH